MKHSIAKIFKNLNLFLLTLLTLCSIIFIFIAEEYHSHSVIDTLNNQKEIITNNFIKKEETYNFNILKYNENIANIKNSIKKLQNGSKYNYISTYILHNSAQYNTDLEQLKFLVENFDQQSRIYMKIDVNTTLNSREEESDRLISFINSMIFKNTHYSKERFNISSKIFLVLFLLLLFTTLWYKKRLDKVYSDVLLLLTIDKDSKRNIFTQEIDSILLRINRKAQTSDNPAMIDPITEINNNKGMIQSYAERKAIKDTNFSAVTIFEIDNFSKSKRTYSQEFTQAILKKVAYAISLHQQATDIIARSDYNQFTLIFSRPSKEQLFKHTDLIRQSISEINLISPDKEMVHITVTGGFINKANSAPLDESIRKAKDLLSHAKKSGKDHIMQIKDLPK